MTRVFSDDVGVCVEYHHIKLCWPDLPVHDFLYDTAVEIGFWHGMPRFVLSFPSGSDRIDDFNIISFVK